MQSDLFDWLPMLIEKLYMMYYAYYISPTHSAVYFICGILYILQALQSKLFESSCIIMPLIEAHYPRLFGGECFPFINKSLGERQWWISNMHA